MSPELGSISSQEIKDIVTNKINEVDPQGIRRGLGLCRRINLETVVMINRTYCGCEAWALIDPNYRHIRNYSSGEHVIGVVIVDDYFFGFDGTVGQLDVGIGEEIRVWEAESLEGLISHITNEIGGVWNKRLISTQNWVEFQL